ncbi:transglutaminase-like domain-containing protein [Nocardioides sp.]|uniref:transglutaminase-like domain-containing protein n=1 Tax=Nocardioides sp. TaxID=35761 RepID=UPI00273554C0|nr:transglutaminase-like domain-containing protein [Nocardioides sp.]MDP3890860.1 transglutaminase-like domain-containing protein [Nocardioides sp.]
MTRRLLLDLGLLVLLCLTALLGLAPTFTGPEFLVVAMAGVLVGVGATVLVGRRGWPRIAVALLVVAAFYLLGGPAALRSEGSGALLPSPATLTTLTDQLVFGWKDLLTTLPPVDGAGPLLVLPWVLGLVAGAAGGVLTGVRRGPAALVAVLPLLVPVALLAAVILLGVREPQSLWVQGVAFVVLGAGWLWVRLQRTTGRLEGTVGHTRRVVAGTTLLVVAGVLAHPVAGAVGGQDDERLILRSHVEPPFDIGQYPSPLSSFRRYVWMPEPDAVNLHEVDLMSVGGVPAGTRVRFAALDEYDGVVWGASRDSDPGSGSGTYQRVSSTIDNPAADGSPVQATVELADGWRGVWLPTVGSLTSLRFEAGDTDELADSFRYNLATSTAVVPHGLRPGDRYTLSAVDTEVEVPANGAPWPTLPDAGPAAAFLDTQALQWTEGESEPLPRVLAAAEHLRREGRYSDGVLAAERMYHPGHHVFRLSEQFVNAPLMVGNAEQYAAVMVLVANRIGVPARVVLGAVVPQGGVVQGKDVTAWVELRLADGRWATLPTEAFMDRKKPAEQPPVSQQEMSGMVVPPPAPIPPPSTIGEQTDAELNARRGQRTADEAGWQLPRWLRLVLVYVGSPLLLALLVVGALVLAKALRRRRRRRADRVSARFVGGWLELVDHARDLGHAVPAPATRREQSRSLEPAAAGAVALAERADTHVFGPEPPESAAAAAYWRDVEAERRSMSSLATRRRRWLAAVSPASLRRR